MVAILNHAQVVIKYSKLLKWLFLVNIILSIENQFNEILIFFSIFKWQTINGDSELAVLLQISILSFYNCGHLKTKYFISKCLLMIKLVSDWLEILSYNQRINGYSRNSVISNLSVNFCWNEWLSTTCQNVSHHLHSPPLCLFAPWKVKLDEKISCPMH